MSPSMRREWIEIPKLRTFSHIVLSPSMRREWIEIRSSLLPLVWSQAVSLHAEGVD